MIVSKNVVLADCDVPDNWDFISGLTEYTGEEWSVKKLVSNRNHGGRLQNLIRYLKYFYFPFLILLGKNKYKRIITWQQFYGLVLSFYFRVFNVKNAPKITVMTFIYKPKSGLKGWIYDKFIEYSVSSNYIANFVVYSKNEVDYYSDIFKVDQSKFNYIRLGVEDYYGRFKTSDNGRFLSAGRSNRDYEFLVSNWCFGDLDIICDDLKCNLKNKYVTIFDNCYGDEFLNLLSKCHAVVISLDDENISSGQLVILQAMMFGKIVICTDNCSVRDYIDDGVNGFIISKNVYDLQRCVNLINDADTNLRISNNARKTFEDKFSEFSMGKSVGRIVND